jgi:hypothetical protein
LLGDFRRQICQAAQLFRSIAEKSNFFIHNTDANASAKTPVSALTQIYRAQFRLKDIYLNEGHYGKAVWVISPLRSRPLSDMGAGARLNSPVTAVTNLKRQKLGERAEPLPDLRGGVLDRGPDIGHRPMDRLPDQIQPAELTDAVLRLLELLRAEDVP